MFDLQKLGHINAEYIKAFPGEFTLPRSRGSGARRRGRPMP